MTDWQKNNPDKVRARSSRRRALERMASGHYLAEDIEALFELQRGKCLCGAPLFPAYHVDHKTPLSRGGSNFPTNIQLLCPFCNLSKGRKTMDEWSPTPQPDRGS